MAFGHLSFSEHLELPRHTHFFKLFLTSPLSDYHYPSLPFSMNMFEYVFLQWLNDLLSIAKVSQDWPPSMHDHMSTPFSVSLSSILGTAVQAFCFTFTKHFYCLQNHCKYIFMFVINLGWTGYGSLQGLCVYWRGYTGFPLQQVIGH